MICHKKAEWFATKKPNGLVTLWKLRDFHSLVVIIVGVHTDAVETQLKTIGFILIKRCAHGVCAYTSSFDTHSSLYPPRRRTGDSAGMSEKLRLRRPLVRQNRQVSVSISEKVSDPRPRVTRPAPAGHTTCARGSRDLRPRVADFLGDENGNHRHWIAFGRSTFASHRATPPCAPCMEGTDGLRGAYPFVS